MVHSTTDMYQRFFRSLSITVQSECGTTVWRFSNIFSAQIQLAHNQLADWQMDFNVTKYHLLCIAEKRKPSNFTYTANSQ